MTAVVHGIHAVASLLERRPGSVKQALLQGGEAGKRRSDLEAMINAHDIPLAVVTREELDAITGGARHQGVALRVTGPAFLDEAHFRDLVVELGDQLCVLVLDGVQDPRNLGACLRSAAAAGCQALVIPKDRAASLTPVAVKAASGAAEIVPVVRVTNLARLLSRLADSGVHLIGLVGDGALPLQEVKMRRPIALVLGSEQRGLRRLTRERCDILATIPMAPGIESLNVAVAAGVALYELNRQTRAEALVPGRSVG